jgi:hypothetical protein
MPLSADVSGIRATYVRLRAVQRSLNTILFGMLSRKGIEESARALDFWEDGVIAFDDEADVQLLSDFAIYEYRAGGHNAVERYLARGDVGEGTDEHTVLEAMQKARFTLLAVEEALPEIGARALDLIYGEAVMLADLGLSETAVPGIVLATRLLAFPTFTMTSGAPLPFDPELAALFVTDLRQAFGRPERGDILPAKVRRRLAHDLTALALTDPEEAKAVWTEAAVMRPGVPPRLSRSRA